ncbi:amino acid ABC transporter permease (plasmid) [Aquamicrobium terrae]
MADLLNSQGFRSLAYQVLLAGFIGLLGYYLYSNVVANLAAQNIATGFRFLDQVSQFEIGERLIAYSARDTYGRAILVGLLNTLVVTAAGIVLATVLGFAIGIARTSRNWPLAKLATGYIEVVRNIPVILQVIFWSVVIRNLPSPRGAIEMGGVAFLSNRGLTVPVPVGNPAYTWMFAAFVVAIVFSIVFSRWARRHRERTGKYVETLWIGLAAMIGLPLLVWLFAGMPSEMNIPLRKGFNFAGGMNVSPEFTALLLGISMYSSGFIAEIVRAGIKSVPRGQTEAARSISLRPRFIMRYIVMPQALRVIVPPLTSQYVSLSKNSSIAVVVGYPDLVNVGNTVMNQTGQAVEAIAIMMVVYLIISVVTSSLMNFYNRAVAIKER